MGRLRRVLTVLISAAVALSQVGCSNSSSLETFNAADSGKTVYAVPGEELNVELFSSGSDECGVPAVSTPSIQFLTSSFIGPQTLGGANELFKFEALTLGG